MKQADPLGVWFRDFESLLCICEGKIVLIWLEKKIIYNVLGSKLFRFLNNLSY